MKPSTTIVIVIVIEIVVGIGRGIVQGIEGVPVSRKLNHNRCVGRQRERVISWHRLLGSAYIACTACTISPSQWKSMPSGIKSTDLSRSRLSDIPTLLLD